MENPLNELKQLLAGQAIIRSQIAGLQTSVTSIGKTGSASMGQIVADLAQIVADLQRVLVLLSPPPAFRLLIIWDMPSPAKLHLNRSKYSLFKENIMPANLIPGQVLGFTFSPVDAKGNPSGATLSLPTGSTPQFVTSDPTVFTVVPDPANPLSRGIATAGLTPPTLPDAASLTVNMTATDVSGTSEQVSGMDTVNVAAAPPPPPPPEVTASLAIAWDVVAAKK